MEQFRNEKLLNNQSLTVFKKRPTIFVARLYSWIFYRNFEHFWNFYIDNRLIKILVEYSITSEISIVFGVLSFFNYSLNSGKWKLGVLITKNDNHLVSQRKSDNQMAWKLARKWQSDSSTTEEWQSGNWTSEKW